MRRKKKLPSRKQRTARYLLALAAVVLLSSLTELYTFTPGRAAIKEADQRGITDAYVVARTRGVKLSPESGKQLCLVEGERAMLLCPVHFNPFAGGWNGGLHGIAGTWDGSGLYGGILQSQDSGVSYAFGRVDDPAVAALSLTVTMENGDVWEQTITPAWQEKDGVRYFVEYVEDLPLEDSNEMEYRITAVGGTGQTMVVSDPASWF